MPALFLLKHDYFFKAVLGSQQNLSESNENSHISPIPPYTTQPPPLLTSRHQNSTFITIHESTLICHYHLWMRVYIGVVNSTGFGKLPIHFLPLLPQPWVIFLLSPWFCLFHSHIDGIIQYTVFSDWLNFT